MDTAPLRLAYRRLLEVATTVADTGSAAPAPGGWDVDQLLAHLVAVDAGVLAAAWSVAAGGPARFDNRSSLEDGTLERLGRRLGDQGRLRERIELQADVLCTLAERLTEDELDQEVGTVLLDGQTRVVDGPLALRHLIGGLAEDHLPRHTEQLLALRC